MILECHLREEERRRGVISVKIIRRQGTCS